MNASANAITASPPRRRLIAPAGSTLPRLAAELDADLFLLDPRGGAQGLAGQLIELTRLLGASAVTIVDVGGDILAKGDEPTLRSPLADSLVLAATAEFDQARVLVTGAGIDGELPETLVLERYAQLRAELVHRLTPTDVEPFRSLFDWHPSEATGLLCAAAAGTRGTAEIRDQGFPVVLSDHTPDVHALPAQRVLRFNGIAQRLQPTRSLQEAEAALLATGRPSEIDYERRKAKQLGDAVAARTGAAQPRGRSPTSSPRSEATQPNAASTSSPCAASPSASRYPETASPNSSATSPPGMKRTTPPRSGACIHAR